VLKSRLKAKRPRHSGASLLWRRCLNHPRDRRAIQNSRRIADMAGGQKNRYARRLLWGRAGPRTGTRSQPDTLARTSERLLGALPEPG
jgi:hypothetical protein